MSDVIHNHESDQQNNLGSGPQWEKPTWPQEAGELERTGQELGISVEVLKEAYKKAVLQELNDLDWEGMENTESGDLTWTIEKVREFLQDKRDFNQIERGLKGGKKLPAPIVLYREGEPPYLIGGNSRLLGCRVLGLRPIVFALRVENPTS